MDNPSRSENTRKAVIQAALAVIARDGPRQLTFDAIAAESGISKGGVMHQFPNKAAVLKGLLEYQIQYFEEFTHTHLATAPGTPNACLNAEIMTLREALADQQSVVLAVLATFVEDPTLLAIVREQSREKVEQIKAETENSDMALVRWAAARGLTITALIGLCPLQMEDRQRIFDYLLDDSKWPASSPVSGN